VGSQGHLSIVRTLDSKRSATSVASPRQYIVIRYSVKQSLPQPDYESLADLRHQIRCFLHFSERAARAAGLEPHQHQLLLALKGLPSGVRPRVRELAERLQIQHHSTVELVNRLAAGGYVNRTRGACDRREVLLSLTAKGERVLKELSLHHRAELRTQGPILIAALKRATEPRHRNRLKTTEIVRAQRRKI
jgi:DNA-binding MarR family transcriptional regulator